MLQVRDLHKKYQMGRQALHVLKGISLDVEKGELLSIVGPSGAGKSTLLHLMGILDTPTSGKVIYDGADLASLDPRRQAYWRNRLFGFVFQFYHLLPDFSALENVSMPALVAVGLVGRRGEKGKVVKRAQSLLAMVNLADRARHRPGQLSGGERQRVAIARALMNQPEVLLCDEPTGNVDTETGRQILDLLCEVRDSTGCTVVVATHDERIAGRSERSVRMIDGRLVK